MVESLREHTRWRTLVSYWAWILTASVSIGGALRASGQYWPAVGFFALAGLAAISKSILVAVDAKEDKLWHRISYAVFWSLVASIVSGAVIWGVYPAERSPVEQAQATQPEAPDPSQPPAPGGVAQTEKATESPKGQTTSAPVEQSTTRAAPPVRPVVVRPPDSSADGCDVLLPDTPPMVALKTGDVVVAGGSGLFRLDANLTETKIASGDYLNAVRGLAVERNGQILATTRACGKGGIVRVDPMTGSQTAIAFGFGTPMGIMIERENETVLIGDENPSRGGGAWGHLWRVNLGTGDRVPLHTFRGDAVATSIIKHPISGDLYYAVRRAVFRIPKNEEGPGRAIELGDLENVQAITVTPQGEMYIAEYNSGPVMHVRLGTPKPLEAFAGFSTIWSLAAANDGKSIFVSYGGGNSGGISRIAFGSPPRVERVWSGRPGGLGTFVTVVGDLDRR